MNKYYCNPINVPYKYQFNRNPMDGSVCVNREAADPTFLYFKGKYYIFASMQLGVWVSDDLSEWKAYQLPDSLPLYGYAPDARVLGDYVYLTFNENEENCNFYRTKDILNGPYEKIEGTFHFSDPDLFADDDGRVYFYWGCSADTPIWGAELDPDTMHIIGDKVPLVSADPFLKGYERVGEDNSKSPCDEAELEKRIANAAAASGTDPETLKKSPMFGMIREILSDRPYVEGAYMNKYQGIYYLQYAFAGTQYNTYGDGVYVSESPLGPFRLARNNPFSYKPGGFIPGAGHGSTMRDAHGNVWHTATMRISMNHQFERRVGIWPAGFDRDGEMFCNQRYGDWLTEVPEKEIDPWKEPEYMLLSAGCRTRASSGEEGHPCSNVTDENIRTWWTADRQDSAQWVGVDLGEAAEVKAVQINFADEEITTDKLQVPVNEQYGRYIEEKNLYTRWLLEGSEDKETWFVLQDKREAVTDLPHDLVVFQKMHKIRFLRLTVTEVPYGRRASVSGIRVFGKRAGEKPAVPIFTAERNDGLDMTVCIRSGNNAEGHIILWGYRPDKLYHSAQTFVGTVRIGGLIRGEKYYVRVDAFNGSGITHGIVQEL